ncbi:MAG: GAF domain-containing protein [Desulfobacterales bacterium]|nr:GAF domain-containing protein [Desulfobacterales bacterium]MDJ0875740.1 GAF domain-containing protein [Desulfobacterales bacterium]
MRLPGWPKKISLEARNLYYRLILVFAIFFLTPLAGFGYFAHKYNLLADRLTLYFLLGFLVFSLLGFFLLRKLYDQIHSVAHDVTNKVITGFHVDQLATSSNELSTIVQSVNAIENQFSKTLFQLEKKASEISILKELSELCYVTFDAEEILYVTLERALVLTKSDIGSVLVIEKADNKYFTVKASIGLGEHVKIGDRIAFETSIAKYAVINKSPLVVADVERDSRFGRANLAHYGTKSFVCMPIKTSKAIVGVLTISRRDGARTYTHDDVEALTPLLSNAAFTYENLRLLRENERNNLQLRAIDKIFRIINSSFKDTELLHAILGEMQSVMPFDLATVITMDANRPGNLVIFDLLAAKTVPVARGHSFRMADTLFERVIRQDSQISINNVKQLGSQLERKIICPEAKQCGILTPLRMEGTVKGVLTLTGSSRNLFNERKELIDWMANTLSFAIERNSLSAAVYKRDRELGSIKQIGNALASSTFDMKQVLKYTMDMIRVIMNVEAGSLLFLKGEELKFAVAFNTRVKSSMGHSIKLGQGIAGYVAAKGRSIIVNDTTRSPHFFAGVDKSTGFRTRSALCVPMISKGRVIGVIEVLNKINGDFTAGDEDLLQSISSSVSIAIENARLYRETVSMAEHERSIRRMFQKFVPKAVLDRILFGSESEKTVIEELRTLTLLNLDIRGFSILSKDVGPQKTVSLLNRFFSVMGDLVFKHQGIVDKYLGDGFLAIFGAPVASTMDADNALNAALEMRRALEIINRQFKREMGYQIKIGISILTGEVVVGNIGFDKKMDYTVIGDAVNAVFRLQDLTKFYPNGILLGETTRRACRSSFKMTAIDATLGDLKLYELFGEAKQQPTTGAKLVELAKLP